jgi:regulator of protease activity HflC (stomatin/prohibitin superfamily)
MAATDRRGEVLALLGALLSLLGAVGLAMLAIICESQGVWTAAFQMLGALGIWILALIQLHQQRLVKEEQFEVAGLERLRQEKLGGAQTIFDEEDLDQMDKLAMGRRLRTIERYLIPVAALIIAVYHLAAGLSVFPLIWQFPPIASANSAVLAEHSRILLFFTGGIAFICFMAARYALGMSRLPDWGVLRAGGDFMFGASAICLANSLVLLGVISGIEWLDLWLARAVGVLLVFLAIETTINFVLDFYRPRVPGQAFRPFYDSRLLGIFSEPGGILRSMANAVDYQFGFKVSETWFYKLVGRAVIPLLLVQVVVVFALTCILVVPPGHKAVVERAGPFGHKVWVAPPGTHMTWFWPIDRATIIPVQRIQRTAVGYEVEDQESEDRSAGPILWTKRHYKKEYQLLVGDNRTSEIAKVPVNVLAINMPVQWRVKDEDSEVTRYHAQSENVAGIVDSLAYRELTQYAAQADLLDLLGEKGIQTAENLEKRLQAACDQAGADGLSLGVKIVHVGIGGIHPPPDEDVAKSYEDVVGAWEARDAKLKEAEGDAIQTRVESAGPNWQRLYDAIVAEDRARESGSPDYSAKAQEVDRILHSQDGVIAGTARETVDEARRRAIDRVFAELSSAERYATQSAVFNVAPHTYALRVYLRMLREGLEDVRKYVIALDEPDKVIYFLDLKPPVEFEAVGAELGAMEAQQK